MSNEHAPVAARTLGDSGVTISPIGFGCASLMRLPSARERAHLLDGAIDAGLTHFDIARMYGLGAAEAELGRVVRGRRDRITVATKFGIDASRGLQRLGRLQAPARAVLARSAKARSAIRSRREAFATPRRYDAEQARISLDVSLRELSLDHVDILFLHDPRPQDEISGPALVEFLEQARASGKIRAWGVSLDGVAGLEVLGRLPAPGVLQLRHDVLAPQPVEQPWIAFGVMSRLAALTSWLERSPERRREWATTLGADPLADDLLAALLLSEAMAQPGAQAIVYATTRASRLSVPARLLSSPLPETQVATFAALAATARPSILHGTS